jgi:catechol 2,3-dioxygenase-like lactoylglutathione lyase family enzyme
MNKGKLHLLGLILAMSVLKPVVLLAAEADLTRYLASHQRTNHPTDVYTDSFSANAGLATLVVDTETEASVEIIINDKQIVSYKDLKETGKIQVPVELATENTIAVTLNGAPGQAVTTRIKQHVNVDFQVREYGTYSGPTRNYDQAERFYAQLGFTTGARFPDTNTLAVANALGIDHPYNMHCELRFLTHGQQLSPIDLIEFFDPVRDPDDDTPYPYLYHLGMTHIAFVTTDLDADYAWLKSQNVEFVAPPSGAPGERFGRFTTLKDPDGTFIQLVEVPDPGEAPTACDENNLPPSTTPSEVPDDEPVFYPCPKTHLVRTHYVNVNVSDFEGAREWFRMLGFTESRPLPSVSTLEEARAFGLDAPFEIIGADLTVPDSVVSGGGVAIRLMQWINPTDDEPPYALPINHPGIQRLVYQSGRSSESSLQVDKDLSWLASKNLLVDKRAALETAGVKLVSDPAPCCTGPSSTGGIMLFFGPDGMIFETGGGVIPQE